MFNLLFSRSAIEDEAKLSDCDNDWRGCKGSTLYPSYNLCLNTVSLKVELRTSVFEATEEEDKAIEKDEGCWVAAIITQSNFMLPLQSPIKSQFFLMWSKPAIAAQGCMKSRVKRLQ
ncbi:hypothetical protein L1987_75835 [Smallanthus sonchifolius]|uniref:Uncharacterized protein n=1 Tax=Smallanthus sonchifolius TaxID=185202 RepID=A0ACB9A7U7_9ASTR|nr:hypothetical protein L1987_75835 [Smallanthus sonchifolius]